MPVGGGMARSFFFNFQLQEKVTLLRFSEISTIT